MATLNARTTILAASNPSVAATTRSTPQVQREPPAILSRFDLYSRDVDEINPRLMRRSYLC
jgi:DNA replicative helicase MCM subunit Mcm2 (Cdc46/Mcm family)